MSKTADDSKKVRWWPWLIGVIAVYIGYWYVIWISGWFSELEKGEFGDTFGALNALFAGLAFAGVIYAILLQRKELALQRQELKLQRKTLEATEVEIRGQKEQLQAQNQTLQKQNFESSFFQLLGLYNDIVGSLIMSKGKVFNSREFPLGQSLGEYHGRECFENLLTRFKNFYDQDKEDKKNKEISQDIEDDDDSHLFAYIGKTCEIFFTNYQSRISHYFRHLYHIVKFVDHSDQEVKAKKFYTDLIRAQLSSEEMGLLFYYGLSDQGAKFKDLVEKYALFEDMPSKVLIDEEHRNLYAPRAYGESK